ncbi:MAG: response regulator transcription factor [Phycisphaerae bacterium]|nr:response regulator transcription factor [Phycisphaerae bacterium]
MQVLVADDDPVYRPLLDELFGEWGFDVVLAADGQEAWEILQGADPPKLLVLDWMMPRMDGFEVCKRIRNETRSKNTYVLMMTGSRKKAEIMKVVVAGADDYLIKPFDPVDLKIHLRSAMRVITLQEELDGLVRVRHAEAPSSS